MSLWRKKAVEMMPSLHKLIISPEVDNPMRLWIEIHSAYVNAVTAKSKGEATIEQVWRYARWCLDDYRNDESENAITCAFLEHLLQDETVKNDLPARITIMEFESFAGSLDYLNSPAEVAAYRKWFHSQRRVIEKKQYQKNDEARAA